MIISLLTIAGHFVWRNNSGGFRVENRFIRAGRAGSSDIIGVHKDTGQFIALEVKRPTQIKNVTVHQKLFLEEVAARGGIARVVTSEHDIEDLL